MAVLVRLASLGLLALALAAGGRARVAVGSPAVGGAGLAAQPSPGGGEQVHIPAEIPVLRSRAPDVGAAASLRGIAVALVLLVGAVVVLSRWKAVRPGGRGPLGPWLVRLGRLGGASAVSAPDRVQLLQSLRVTARASLHVVRWDGREWLLGSADGNVVVVASRASAVERAAGEDRPATTPEGAGS